MRSFGIPIFAVCVVAGAALSGCGGGSDPAGEPAQGAPAPAPLSAQAPSSVVPRATPADYRGPLHAYRGYVAGQLATMARDVTSLRGALDAGDVAGARDAWRRANARYQRIGAAYGAFGPLDQAVAGLPDGLPRGTADPQFTGLHRVEYALWARRSLPDARRAAAGLDRALVRMRRAVPTVAIPPLDYALRAHEIMEDTLHLQLTGRASPWSGAAYDGAAANVAGTRTVVATVRPLIERRSPGTAGQIDRSLDRLDAALAALRRDGRYPALADVGQRDRERVAALAAAAAETLSVLPALIDPRPPRPDRGVFAPSSP